MSRQHHQDPRPSIRTLLADPGVRGPLKAVLRAWTDRDPLDAAEDAGLLVLALERRVDEHLVCVAVFGANETPA